MGVLVQTAHLIVVLVLLTVALLLMRWGVRDARRRGKPALAVMLLVIAFFPLGLAIWLVFRPEPVNADPARSFGLKDHQLQ